MSEALTDSDLETLFADAMDDVRGMDTTTADYARACVKALHEVDYGQNVLDAAYEAVNALGGTFDKADPWQVGYDHAVGLALKEIEKLGGMDPVMRRQSQADLVTMLSILESWKRRAEKAEYALASSRITTDAMVNAAALQMAREFYGEETAAPYLEATARNVVDAALRAPRAGVLTKAGVA